MTSRPSHANHQIESMPRKALQKTSRTRALRAAGTKSEGLLWSVLRGKQLSGLKFRRQHPVGPYFVDFACVSKRAVVEIDGGCHDQTGQWDLDRESYLRQRGWEVVRFADREVEEDVEAVARQIAKRLGVPYGLRKRAGTGSGMDHVDAPGKRSE